jgi:hypothetical protein
MLNAFIPHIISPLSAPWCGWTMLVLLLCAVLGEWFQPGVISQSVSSVVVRSDRTYKDAPVNLQGQLLVSLFRIGTIGMALCLCRAPEGSFSFAAFWVACGLTLGVLILKMLCNLILDYTFTINRRFGAPYEHYSNIVTLGTAVMYPILLILIHASIPAVTRWSLATVAALFGLVWLYRCLRTYVVSINALVYVLIYFVTLEILPFAGLTYIFAKTLTLL